ncbi:MAG: hypothetical protein IPK85_05375 [Gemmatimonadetes bacterium]|nr:hypothetical protein [Gemmatimonadota bacterium]
MTRATLSLSLLLLVGVTACRSAPREGADETQSSPSPAPSTPTPGSGNATQGAPVLSSLAPDSVRLASNTISEITLRGSGFATTGSNTIRIGPVAIPSVPANAAGTEIRIVVPARYSTSVESPPRPLMPGSYPVTVEARGLTSAPLTLKVVP